MTDRYDEEEAIGEGGMSTILRAFDKLLGRPTAHKKLKSRYVRSERHIDRFTSEARLTGQLEHPNIVPVHEYGRTPEGAYYINMKLVEGQTLAALIDEAGENRTHADQLSVFVQILLKVCDALSFAHSKNIVHRDLKPSNIMVGPFGEVYLMDWGVAVRFDENQADDITGTPAFMAPEQITGAPCDPRTDVFALGATIYYCVAGRPPYPGPTPMMALTQALECNYTPLEEVLDVVPPGVDAIINRAMQKDMDARYPTMAALKHDLEQWLRGRWHLPTRAFEPGDIVVKEGDPGEEAFIIVSGRCEARKVINGADTVLSTMGPGDVFGEMAIFSSSPRSSNVVCSEPMVVQVVTRTTLAAATGLDSWVGKFITQLASRFLDAEERLHQSGRD